MFLSVAYHPLFVSLSTLFLFFPLFSFCYLLSSDLYSCNSHTYFRTRLVCRSRRSHDFSIILSIWLYICCCFYFCLLFLLSTSDSFLSGISRLTKYVFWQLWWSYARWSTQISGPTFIKVRIIFDRGCLPG